MTQNRPPFSIINQYVRFVDEEPDKRKNDWKLNDRWAWFIGDNRQSLKLTTKPEPYTLDRTLRWVQRQVAPTLKMLKKIDKGNGTDYMETIEKQAKLTEKHRNDNQTADDPCKRFGGKLGVIKMWVLLKDFLLVSMGMGIGVVLMCILNVGKEADYEMKQLKESEDN